MLRQKHTSKRELNSATLMHCTIWEEYMQMVLELNRMTKRHWSFLRMVLTLITHHAKLNMLYFLQNRLEVCHRI